MKQRTITTQEQLEKAILALKGLSDRLPIVITVTEGTKTRTSAQNARYWAEVQYFMSELNEILAQAAEESGYTQIEMRRLVAEQLPVEQAVILYARKKEVVHDVLKDICGIPTSTRLGTKEFSRFDEVLAQTMSEIIGNIRGFLR